MPQFTGWHLYKFKSCLLHLFVCVPGDEEYQDHTPLDVQSVSSINTPFPAALLSEDEQGEENTLQLTIKQVHCYNGFLWHCSLQTFNTAIHTLPYTVITQRFIHFLHCSFPWNHLIFALKRPSILETCLFERSWWVTTKGFNK